MGHRNSAKTSRRGEGDVRYDCPSPARLGADALSAVNNGPVHLVTRFRADRIVDGADGTMLVATDGRQAAPFDRIIAATGFRSDLGAHPDLGTPLESPALITVSDAAASCCN